MRPEAPPLGELFHCRERQGENTEVLTKKALTNYLEPPHSLSL